MKQQCFEVIYQATGGVDETIPGQVPMQNVKLVMDASRCPCWRCERQAGCISEYKRFRVYCRAGEAE